MMSNVSIEQTKSKLDTLLVKLREAEKNENSCMAKQDFNTAAYWSKIYKEIWNEYTETLILLNKILGEWEES